jgi:hypothetical protein
LNFQNLLRFILNPFIYSPWFKFEYLKPTSKISDFKSSQKDDLILSYFESSSN